MNVLTESGALEVLERLVRAFDGSGEAIPSLAEIEHALVVLSDASHQSTPEIPGKLDRSVAGNLADAAKDRAYIAKLMRKAEVHAKRLRKVLPKPTKKAPGRRRL